MITDDIKKFVKDKKAVIGTEQTIKMLKQGRVTEVFLSSNCMKETKETIQRYASLGGVKVTDLEIPNDELGVICKKPFMISVLSVSKE
ncbi:MAG TPA: ribosomal L7Ae/L30e/S12e/Gadd45 family protein [Candidatus Nanoarchaeia archaeon]|nr:ribosomal L7Ae/L30e/S12e/Gadd45 family protein [Candidatus Nanoarchaeia archaeon]